MKSSFVRRILGLSGALLASLALAAGASAQGMYYKEIQKDGRIYVFNDAKKADAFEKSGEMGTGLTRPGAGPNGETVVADSEQALQLFFFKHGISQVVETPPPPVQRVEWRDGKTRFTLGKNFYMEMSNRIQPRFTYQMPDDSVRLPGTENAGDSKGSFRIRRAKFKLEGWFYKPELEYEVQLNWPDVTGSPASRFLEDANIDWDPTKKKQFRIRFGQFKAPYGRQQLTSSGAQQFVDRADTDGRYNPGRETGLALWGTLGGNKLDWRAMISNGNGRSQELNDNDKYLYSARVMWQALGNTRMNQWGSGALMTEGDLGDSQGKPLLAIAGNFLKNDRRFTGAIVPPATTPAAVNADTQWGFDYSFKYKGFASVAEYTNRESTPYVASVKGSKFTDSGYLFQASYAFKAPGQAGAAFWEIAARYSTIDPSDARSGNDREEIGGAFSYYYNKHNLKVQADYRQLKDDAANSGAGTTTKEFRLQTQFIF
ncbi:MAG TPA: porin [Vicinamibacteria bacterium]|nr:porin [Vicinamibacteria bacterium]